MTWQNGGDHLLRLRQLHIKLRMAVPKVTLEKVVKHTSELYNYMSQLDQLHTLQAENWQ